MFNQEPHSRLLFRDSCAVGVMEACQEYQLGMVCLAHTS